MHSNSLPGWDLVRAGVADLARGDESVESLLVSVARGRLSRLGVDVPPATSPPRPAAEIRLYQLLCNTQPHDAYSNYNALLRRLGRFVHALEHEQGRRLRQGTPDPLTRTPVDSAAG
jgi:hypothetical protein